MITEAVGEREPPMVLSWYSWNWPLTKRSTRLDFPTADSPSRTSLNWQILFPAAGPLGRPAMTTHWRCGSESGHFDTNKTRRQVRSGTTRRASCRRGSERLHDCTAQQFYQHLQLIYYYYRLTVNFSSVYSHESVSRSRYIAQTINQHNPVSIEEAQKCNPSTHIYSESPWWS